MSKKGMQYDYKKAYDKNLPTVSETSLLRKR